ncbi:MAG: hypothetical protein PHY16_07695 [Methylobacter sp.]|nr:hypothetical protein [Methylobacter sp.]
MNINLLNVLHHLALISTLLATSTVQAFIITGSGVDGESKHFVIDSAVSKVDYNPGLIIFGPQGSSYPSAKAYNVAGSFDADISHYWYSYYLDGDSQGTQGTFIHALDSLKFTNPAIFISNLPHAFEFPGFVSEIINATNFNFSLNSPSCDVPAGAVASCTIMAYPNPLFSLFGQIHSGKISLDGFQPLGPFFGGFTYHFEASVVPLPAAFWLFASALGFCGMLTRQKSRKA